MPKLSELLFGKKDKIKKATTLTPQQEELMSLINEGLTSGEGPFGELFGGFDQEGFEKGVTQPALKNFQENILPQIQEKFIAGNQVLGSGMRNAQLKAGTELQDKLAQLMYQAQQKQKENQMGGIQSLLNTRAFENIYKKGYPGAAAEFLSSFAKSAGQQLGGGGGGGAGVGSDKSINTDAVVKSAQAAIAG